MRDDQPWIETDAGGGSSYEWLDVFVDGDQVVGIDMNEERIKVRVTEMDREDGSIETFRFDRR